MAALTDLLSDFAGLVQEAPGLLRWPLPTPTLPPATTTNHYFVGSRRGVLVDPSTPVRAAQDQLCALIQALARHGWHVEALLLSHHHRDHCGAATELSLRLGLPIWAHPRTAELLDGEVTVHRTVHDLEVVAEDADGGEWSTLHTPGHAPGHLVLQHDRSRGMVAGDMVAGEGTILVDPRDGRMSDYLASLQRMAAAEPTFLAPAHGPVLPDGPAVLAFYRHHRLQREARILAALPSDWIEPADLLPVAYGDVSRLAWAVALRSMLAHLEHLHEQGRAARQGDKWRRIGPIGE